MRDGARAGLRDAAVRVGAGALAALEQLAGGLGTALLAVVVLLAVLITAVLSLVGVGLVLVPVTVRAVRAVADR